MRSTSDKYCTDTKFENVRLSSNFCTKRAEHTNRKLAWTNAFVSGSILGPVSVQSPCPSIKCLWAFSCIRSQNFGIWTPFAYVWVCVLDTVVFLFVVILWPCLQILVVKGLFVLEVAEKISQKVPVRNFQTTEQGLHLFGDVLCHFLDVPSPCCLDLRAFRAVSFCRGATTVCSVLCLADGNIERQGCNTLTPERSDLKQDTKEWICEGNAKHQSEDPVAIMAQISGNFFEVATSVQVL